jgi:DNA-binding transcriptional LysR family regulator
MNDMRQGHVTRADLNLLPVLDLLLEEGSVTRAADRLELTQSAVSRALSRLRRLFRDPLFIRTSRGLEPTRRARELGTRLRRALEEVGSILAAAEPFDPRTATRRFRIAAVDYAQVTLLAPLARRLAREAPLIEIELRQPSLESERDLESGVLDLLIALRQPSGPAIVWTPLHEDGYTCIVWKKHPCRRLSVDRYAQMAHVLVAPRDRPGGILDDVFAARGLSRRVVVQVPTFLSVPHVLVGTERIATVPKRMARVLAASHPVRELRPPLAIPRFTMCAGWHEIHRKDAAHRWLR